LSLYTSPFFVVGIFEIGSHFLPGLVLTETLLISASPVAKITGVSHQCPAQLAFRTTFSFYNLIPQELDYPS
jgi:hypothetical protein